MKNTPVLITAAVFRALVWVPKTTALDGKAGFWARAVIDPVAPKPDISPETIAALLSTYNG
jgi:hypothetical protein